MMLLRFRHQTTIGWSADVFLRECGNIRPPSHRPTVFKNLPFEEGSGNFNVMQFYGDTRLARFSNTTFYVPTQVHSNRRKVVTIHCDFIKVWVLVRECIMALIGGCHIILHWSVFVMVMLSTQVSTLLLVLDLEGCQLLHSLIKYLDNTHIYYILTYNNQFQIKNGGNNNNNNR